MVKKEEPELGSPSEGTGKPEPVKLDIMVLMEQLGIAKEKWYEFSHSKMSGPRIQDQDR